MNFIDKLTANDIAVIGVPFDDNSSYMQGSSDAPALIRKALFSNSSNLWTENLIDLQTAFNWHFLPDIDFQGCEENGQAFDLIENSIAELLNKKARVITLGGDHSVTLPIIRAFAKFYPKLNILHMDAHPDLYDELDGNRYSHASPFARIMEEQLAVRLVQVGIRTLTGHQNDQAKRFGVEIIDMKRIEKVQDLTFSGPLYLSFDLDCLDPAFAPGVSHYEPGGMSTREALTIIQNLKGQLVGADIVEFNPKRDPQGITAMVASKLLKEILAKMLAA